MEVCPVEPLAAAAPSLAPQECLPPDPGPDPEPEPEPEPGPEPSPTPGFSVSPDPSRPEMTPEMAQALREAGLPDPYSVGQTYTGSCNIALYVKAGRTGYQGCLFSAPANRILKSDQYPGSQAVRWEPTQQRRCSIEQWTVLADGGNVKSRTEIDSIYGQAIDAALKVGQVDLGVKLGQMRDYHLRVIDLSSDRATVQIVFKAVGGSRWSGKGGNCNGKVWMDFVGR